MMFAPLESWRHVARIATQGCRYGRVRTRRRFVPPPQAPDRQTVINEIEALAQPRVA
jgi:hypothetical protein